MLKFFYAHTPWVSVLSACLHILWLALTPHLATTTPCTSQMVSRQDRGGNKMFGAKCLILLV